MDVITRCGELPPQKLWQLYGRDLSTIDDEVVVAVSDDKRPGLRGTCKVNVSGSADGCGVGGGDDKVDVDGEGGSWVGVGIDNNEEEEDARRRNGESFPLVLSLTSTVKLIWGFAIVAELAHRNLKMNYQLDALMIFPTSMVHTQSRDVVQLTAI